MKTIAKNRWIYSILIILFLYSFAYAGVVTEVVVNKSAIINLKKSSERVSLANPAIADVVIVSPTQIMVNGKVIGSTTLLVWEKGVEKPSFFDIRVVGDLSQIEHQIKAITPKDEINVEFAKDTIVLSGTAKNQQTIDKAVQIAQSYAPKVINHITIEEAQQVMLEVRVAQIDKSKLKELGIGFLAKGSTAEITAPGLIGTPSGNVGGGADFNVVPGIASFDLTGLAPQIGVAHFPSGVAAVLKALATKGYAKVLAEPNLVVRSGEKGNFLAGTKVPVQVVTGTPPTPSIEYMDVGVKLNFVPEVLETGVIRLKIDPAEVSNIIRYLQFAGGLTAPEIDTREVRTSVDLKEGESVVLAGLLSEEMKKNMQKIPILGDIPILGLFFRSTEDELREKELAFFITPKLIKPLAPGVKPELPGDKKLTPDEEREFQWIPLPKAE